MKLSVFLVAFSCCMRRGELVKDEESPVAKGSKEFLFSRSSPGGLLGLVGPHYLPTNPYGGVARPRVHPNALLGAMGAFPSSLRHKSLPGGIHSSHEGLNPLLGQPGLDSRPGVSERLDGLNLHYLNQLLKNEHNNFQTPLFNQKQMNHQNILNEQQLAAIQQLHQFQQLQRLRAGSHQQQPLPLHQMRQNMNFASQQPNNDALMELLILQYILGNDGVKDILDPSPSSRTDHPSSRHPQRSPTIGFFPPSLAGSLRRNLNTFPEQPESIYTDSEDHQGFQRLSSEPNQSGDFQDSSRLGLDLLGSPGHLGSADRVTNAQNFGRGGQVKRKEKSLIRNFFPNFSRSSSNP